MRTGFFKRTIAFLITAAVLLAVPLYSYAAGASDIITDMVFTYKSDGIKALSDVNGYLSELRSENPELADIWSTIMHYWFYSNTDQVINPEKLPENLPEDNSLCIVVMGFQLNDDGSMQDELINRLEVAMNCLEQYPKAYVAVTGGGTAKKTVKKTEADAMAEYLKGKGIPEDRILIENRSITTCENALYLGEQIIKNYPDITSIAIVTSDYHVPESSLLFREYMYLSRKVGGSRDVQVVSNAAYMADTPQFADTLAEQAPYVWSIADTFGVIG